MELNRLYITPHIFLFFDEIKISAIRSQGPGGQHINKTSTAIELRFDVRASSLPTYLKERILSINDSRINKDGVIIIKAQQHRSQKKNKDNAIARLVYLLNISLKNPKSRIPTTPSKSSKEKRIENKKKRSQLKKMRKKVNPE